jgi:hypothetical protein
MALVNIRATLRGLELTPADLGLMPTPKRRGRPRKARHVVDVPGGQHRASRRGSHSMNR